MSTLTQPTPLSSPAPADFALSNEQLDQRRDAKKRRRKIDRTIDMAAVSAWSLAIFAALSLPFAFSSFKAAFITAGLALCAYFEFRGRAGLKRLELRAPSLLARNQAALAGIIAMYCGGSVYDAWFGDSIFTSIIQQAPEVAELLEPYETLIRQVTAGTYAVVAFITLIVQAFVIRYYASRRRLIEQYIAETPAWVLQLDKT